MPEHRKLAAILAADVVGYSKLAGSDEERTLARLRALRSDLIDPTIAVHHGRVVKRTGDGSIIEFRSVVDAVRCAIEVQKGMVERNAGLPPERRIEFRVGIHLGDVVEESDGDLMGDGVNIAARLEGICAPNGICLSEDAYRQVKARLDLAVIDLGTQQLKNIAEPVRVYQSSLVEVAAKSAPALTPPDKPSIAVLPFQNMSGDPEQEYFADGIVEDIITALSRFSWLMVIARNSTFTYKHKTLDVKQIGRELGVRYVLEGSVRKAANRVRITGQLIHASTGAHLWADRFDGALEEIFDLQDRVTASAIGAIEPRLRFAEIDRAQTKPTDSLDAYDFYLRALPNFHALTQDGNEQALKLLHQALKLDPGYALAAAMAAWCHGYRRAHGWVFDLKKEAQEALQLAQAALDADSYDAEVLHMSGFTLAYVGGDNETGALLLGRSLSINPNSALAWSASGHIKGWLGEPEVAIEHFTRAIRLSPFDPMLSTFYGGIAMAHFVAKHYASAVEWADKAVRIGPKFQPAYRWLAAGLAKMNATEEARAVIQRAMALDSRVTLTELQKRLPSFSRSLLDDYLDGLRKAGIPEY
jgi:TolB-like protein/Tfp pilus assembly protein PilF